jgi:hypothetical protein
MMLLLLITKKSQMSQRASYIGAIRADQTVESDHSDLFGTVGNMLAWTRALTGKLNILYKEPSSSYSY